MRRYAIICESSRRPGLISMMGKTSAPHLVATALVLACASAAADVPHDNTCAAACGQIVRCRLAPADQCVAVCRQSGAEASAKGRDMLAAVVHASCEQLKAAMQTQKQPAPPPSKTDKQLWGCWAQGAIETCNGNCVVWGSYSVSGYGYGKTRDAAAVMAATQCETQISIKMSIANMNGRARVRAHCNATTCSPPK